MKKILSKILVLLLAVLLSVNVPISALAESIPLDTEIVADDNASLVTPVMNENGGYSIGSYTYTPPKAGKFWIRDVEGILTITDDTPVITFADFTVTIPEFDWYKIASQGNEEFFYRADVLKSPENANNFVYAAVQTPISFLRDSSYALYLQYFVEAENRMYNIKAILTEAQFFFFDHLSNPHSMGNDDLSERLKLSADIYTEGSFENRNINTGSTAYSVTAGNTASPASLNYIAPNSYDSYTNDDGIIKSYVSDHWQNHWLEDGWTMTDDPIVSIVPKELCLIPGSHLYIGKEYGFFIHVFEGISAEDVYAVGIMVFDITHVTPSFMGEGSSETGSTTIEPLFQYQYNIFASYEVLNPDPSLSHLIIYDMSTTSPNYCLKDVGVYIFLDNPTALNWGDNGYDDYEDDGAFITCTWAGASGIGLRQYDYSFEHDTATFLLGFIPIVGEITSVADYACAIIEEYTNQTDQIERDEKPVFTEDVRVDAKKTNNTDQIGKYEKLIKTQLINFNSHSNKPRLIDIGGYVTTRYLVARKSYSDYNKIRVKTTISLSVVKDNTTKYNGGQLVYYGNSTSTYQTSEYYRLEDADLTDIVTNITVPANTQTNIVRITPSVTGSYFIRTQSTQGDPHFRITNATTGAQAVIATDNISTSNKNAELTIDLVKDNVYYLEAFHQAGPHEYTVRIGYNPMTTQILEEDTPYSVTVAADSYQVLEFTPSSSGLHWLYATGTDEDVQMFMLHASGDLVDVTAYNTTPNLQQEYYLDYGNTYYIIVQGPEGAAVATTVTASTMYY